MPTFIDESGDAGPGKKSSRHFRLAAAWFETAEQVDEFLASVLALRHALRLTSVFEFHFANLPHHLRTAYLELVAAQPLQYAVCSFDKGVDRKSLTKETIIRETIRPLAGAFEETYQISEACKRPPTPGQLVPLNERVVCDECNDPVFSRAMSEVFCSLPSLTKPGARLVKKVTFDRSRSDPRLQLADMICGAVGRELDGDAVYRRLIRRKELQVIQLLWNNERVVPVGTTLS